MAVCKGGREAGRQAGGQAGRQGGKQGVMLLDLEGREGQAEGREGGEASKDDYGQVCSIIVHPCVCN